MVGSDPGLALSTGHSQTHTDIHKCTKHTMAASVPAARTTRPTQAWNVSHGRTVTAQHNTSSHVLWTHTAKGERKEQSHRHTHHRHSEPRHTLQLTDV